MDRSQPRAWEAVSIRDHTPHHHTLFGIPGFVREEHKGRVNVGQVTKLPGM